MNNPGVWIFGSVADDVRRAGLGILVEYAYGKASRKRRLPAICPGTIFHFGRSRGAKTG